jgi:8-oxo-dGTP pyrophosphatase MutT (NUDIX family)
MPRNRYIEYYDDDDHNAHHCIIKKQKTQTIPISPLKNNAKTICLIPASCQKILQQPNDAQHQHLLKRIQEMQQQALEHDNNTTFDDVDPINNNKSSTPPKVVEVDSNSEDKTAKDNDLNASSHQTFIENNIHRNQTLTQPQETQQQQQQHNAPISPPLHRVNHSNNKMITSYGIILCTIVRRQLKFMLYQRRDTYEYCCIIRGLYSPTKLEEYINLLTLEEVRRLKRYRFDQLWNDFWFSSNCRGFRKDYTFARNKYNAYYKALMRGLNKFLQEYRSGANHEQLDINHDNLWLFPKGKKNVGEHKIQCAQREFAEEVNIDAKKMTIVSHEPYVEIFKGTDERHYQTFYYLAYSLTGPLQPRYYQRYKSQSIRQGQYISDEAIDVQWFDVEQIRHLFRDKPYRCQLFEKLYCDLNAKVKRLVGQK